MRVSSSFRFSDLSVLRRHSQPNPSAQLLALNQPFGQSSVLVRPNAFDRDRKMLRGLDKVRRTRLLKRSNQVSRQVILVHLNLEMQHTHPLLSPSFDLILMAELILHLRSPVIRPPVVSQGANLQVSWPELLPLDLSLLCKLCLSGLCHSGMVDDTL